MCVKLNCKIAPGRVKSGGPGALKHTEIRDLYFTKVNGVSPSEKDFQNYFNSSLSAVRRMISNLEKRKMILPARLSSQGIFPLSSLISPLLPFCARTNLLERDRRSKALSSRCNCAVVPYLVKPLGLSLVSPRATLV